MEPLQEFTFTHIRFEPTATEGGVNYYYCLQDVRLRAGLRWWPRALHTPRPAWTEAPRPLLRPGHRSAIETGLPLRAAAQSALGDHQSLPPRALNCTGRG